MEFDYIIIGAGSVGCVLANRLTKDGKSTALRLEAGGDRTSRASTGYGDRCRRGCTGRRGKFAGSSRSICAISMHAAGINLLVDQTDGQVARRP